MGLQTILNFQSIPTTFQVVLIVFGGIFCIFLFLLSIELLLTLIGFIISEVGFQLKKIKRENERLDLEDLKNASPTMPQPVHVPPPHTHILPISSPQINIGPATITSTGPFTKGPYGGNVSISPHKKVVFTSLEASTLMLLLTDKIKSIEEQMASATNTNQELRLTLLTLKFIASECERMI